MSQQTRQQPGQQQTQPELQLQRIYVKDISLETPSTPEIFRQEWKPEISVDLNVNHKKLEDDSYEVILSATVTAKMQKNTVFLVEAQQAGIFYLKGFGKKELEQVLGAYCPNILFPYVREVVSDLVTRASFPQLNLAPINFDALYLQQKQDGQKPSQGEKTH